MANIIYGRNPVFEALKAGWKFEKIVIAEHAEGHKIYEILALAGKLGIYVQQVSSKKLMEIAKQANSQGVLAYVHSQVYANPEDILQRCQQLNEPPFLALLDGVEDPHNLGAIVRTADGAGLHGIILPKRRSAGLTSTVAKTSAGASAHVLIVQVTNLSYTMDELKERNVWLVGADQNADQIYYEADLSGALGIVIGAEGSGLHRLVKEKCDFLVKIPMYGKLNSLNVSVAAALIFFEARKQRELTIRKLKS